MKAKDGWIRVEIGIHRRNIGLESRRNLDACTHLLCRKRRYLPEPVKCISPTGECPGNEALVYEAGEGTWDEMVYHCAQMCDRHVPGRVHRLQTLESRSWGWARDVLLRGNGCRRNVWHR